MFVWNDAKSAANAVKHGLAFEAAHRFDWDDPVIVDRSRGVDGEKRYAAIGTLDKKLHTVIFTLRDASIRIISLRRSNPQEEKLYAQTP